VAKLFLFELAEFFDVFDLYSARVSGKKYWLDLMWGYCEKGLILDCR
jgi:hypothetical protein